mgnify:CR=1 FL=1|jgi:hypothetical protein
MILLDKWKLREQCKFVFNYYAHSMEKKFKNDIKAMQTRHIHSIVALDQQYEKNISNRPRY